LFATLDATTRKLFIAGRDPLVLSDTVGFIRDLPHTLVAAFRATLEETVQADLLLHVVDASSSNRSEQIDEVNKVLKEIGADHIPQILVLNKADLIDLPASSPGYQRDEYGRIVQVRLSAKTGEGLEFINLALSEALGERAALREPDNQPEAWDITSGYH
jgi:GTP-binding protein HflX